VPPRGTLQWLRGAGVRPRKAWGQCFLIQPGVARRLVEGWGLPPGAAVLEIGAGAGSLTLPLLEGGARVVGVERDARLASLLEERVRAECPAASCRVVAADVLSVDPGELIAESPWPGPWHLVGNLPYAITTPILEWTARHRARFAWASFMVQREYGARLLARPGGGAYGALTVWAGYRFALRRELAVGAAGFWPRPKVDSVVVRLLPHAAPPVEAVDEGALERVVRAAFGQRRKVMGGALAHGLRLPRERVEAALVASGIGPRQRAEECDLARFAALARELAPDLGGTRPHAGRSGA
jgi:16S rRNA (adenine1518-N6/adenine1519-N6)-dimethyltransferase